MIPLSFFSAFITPPKGWLMGVFKGYFDDSGHEYDSTALSCSLGGYVGTNENWKYFEEEWPKVLSNYDIKYLHMKEFAHFRGPFKKFKNEPNCRASLLKALIKVIKDSNIIGFTSTIYLDKLNELNKRKNRFIAFAVNMYSCLWCISNKWPNKVIELKFDKTEKFNTKKNKAEDFAKRDSFYYERYKYIDATKINEKLSSIDIPALQAADLLAYEMAKEVKTRIELTKDICPRKAFTENNINYSRRRESMLNLLESTIINNNFQWYDIIQLGLLIKGNGYLSVDEDNEIKFKLPHQ